MTCLNESQLSLLFVETPARNERAQQMRAIGGWLGLDRRLGEGEAGRVLRVCLSAAFPCPFTAFPCHFAASYNYV